jgi:hypothetical protein
MPVIEFKPLEGRRLDEIELGIYDSIPCDVEPVHAAHKRTSMAGDILREAADLVDSGRAKQHGPMEDQHEAMAALITTFLNLCTLPLKPSQAALIEVCLKLSRTQHGEFNEDDYRDGAAYFGIACQLAKKEWANREPADDAAGYNGC